MFRRMFRAAVLAMGIAAGALCCLGAGQVSGGLIEITDDTVKYKDEIITIEITGTWESAAHDGLTITFEPPSGDHVYVTCSCAAGYKVYVEDIDPKVKGGHVTYGVKSDSVEEDSHEVTLNFERSIVLDLDCDADWDGEIEDEEDDPIEVSVGGIVGLEKTADLTLQLEGAEDYPDGRIEVTLNGGIMLLSGDEPLAWGDDQSAEMGRNVAVLSGRALSGPLTVKGIQSSWEFGDCEIKASFIDEDKVLVSDVVSFTVVSVDVSIDGQGEHEEESEGAYSLFVDDCGETPYAPRATNYLKKVSIKILPNDFPEYLQTNLIVELDGDVDHLLELKPTVASWGMTQYAPAEKTYNVKQLNEQNKPNKDGLPYFALHGHSKSSSLRDKHLAVTETKTGVEDQGLFTVVKLNLVPDYDRNHKIDSDDEREMCMNKKQLWWVNDDFDKNDCSSCFIDEGSDVPGQNKNNSDKKVNMCTDLLDFFPVWIDIKHAIDLFRESGTKFVLVNNGYGIVRTKLSTSNAGDFLFKLKKITISNEDTNIATVDIEHECNLADTGDFFGIIKENAQEGILMTEGRVPTGTMELSVRSKNDKEILKVELPTRLLNIEQMYNRALVKTDGSAEQALMDDDINAYYTADCDVVYIHGFKVSKEAARGWNSDMFKRLYQSGSNARFWGVTWNSYADGWLKAPGQYYHIMAGDVAFATAKEMSKVFRSARMKSHVVVMAHSLGNMVVSSAIVDYGWRPNQYFMLNAAVPVEAYCGRKIEPAPTETAYYLIHQDWRVPGEKYPAESYCANWYRLFEDDVAECPWRKLTWVNRFAELKNMTTILNYYSPDEEVFEILKDNINMLDGAVFFSIDTNNLGKNPILFDLKFVNCFARYCWQKQELVKGLGDSITSPLNPVLKSSYCGWKFSNGSTRYGVSNGQISELEHKWYLLWEPWFGRIYSAKCADAIVGAGLSSHFKSHPVFEGDPTEMFDFSNPAYVTRMRNHLLACGIPALSPAVGRPYEAPVIGEGIRMPELCSKQERYERSEYKKKWLHCDLKDLPYYSNFMLYDSFVSRGCMK